MSDFETFYNQPIVLDNGSGNIQCGFSGMDSPIVSYSNIIGRPKYYKINYLPSDINIDDTFVGNEAQIRRGLLKLNYPINHGIVENWNDLELIWNQVLCNDLINNYKNHNENNNTEIKLNDHTILLADHPFNPRKQKEKMSELLYENFDIGAINIAIPSVLSLYSTGRTTGCVIDSGDGVTCITPIFDGFALPGSLYRMNLAGRDITKQLQFEIMKNGYNLLSSSEFEILRNLKERLSFVKPFDSNLTEFQNSYQVYELPDGKILKIKDTSLAKPCELLFNPESFGFEETNLQNALYNSIMKVDINLRSKLFETLVLSGGSTMFKNFGSRLINELRNLDDEIKLKMFASPDRKNSCFIGGSILSSLSTFKNIVITKKQFMENPQSIHDKYF